MDNNEYYILDTDGSKKSLRDASIFELYYEPIYRSSTSHERIKQKHQQQKPLHDNNNINYKPEPQKMCNNNYKFNYQCSSKIPPSATSSTSEDKTYNNVNNISAYNNNDVSNINNDNLSQKQDLIETRKNKVINNKNKIINQKKSNNQ